MKIDLRLAICAATIQVVVGAVSTRSHALSDVCIASDLSSVRNCFENINQYRVISISSDIHCGASKACCTNDGKPIMLIHGKIGKSVLGNGHTFSRSADQRRCAALDVSDSTNIAISNLRVDDDKSGPACTLDEKACAPTINIFSDTDVSLSKVDIFNGKGYTIKVWDTNGLSLINSIVSNAGEIGLYVGHYRYGSSRNIVVTGSTFAKSRANGVAIQGANGTGALPIVIKDNLFIANHWHGVWPVAEGPRGALTTGGQLLIGDGANIQVVGNVITTGKCLFCWHSEAVAAIELGDSPHAPGGVKSVKILDNDFLNGVSHPITDNVLNGVEVSSSLYRAGSRYTSYAVTQNRNTLVDDLAIQGNRETGFDMLARIDSKTNLGRNVLDPQYGDGGTSDLWVNFQANSHLELKAMSSSYGAFGFSEAPAPDTVRQPLVWCSSTKTELRPFVAEYSQCRHRDIVDIIGYPEIDKKDGESAAYLCESPKKSNRGGYLSWKLSCDNGTLATAVGYAVEGLKKGNIP